MKLFVYSFKKEQFTTSRKDVYELLNLTYEYSNKIPNVRILTLLLGSDEFSEFMQEKLRNHIVVDILQDDECCIEDIILNSIIQDVCVPIAIIDIDDIYDLYSLETFKKNYHNNFNTSREYLDDIMDSISNITILKMISQDFVNNNISYYFKHYIKSKYRESLYSDFKDNITFIYKND